MTKSDQQVRVLFLDFDGVIVESLDIKTDAFRELFQVYQAQIGEIMGYHLRNNSVSRLVKFKFIYEQILGLTYDDAMRESVAHRFSEIVFKKVVACPFVTGAEALLSEFSGRVPIYVISASPEGELRRVIAARELADYFDDVHGTPGTKSEHIERVLGELKISPSQAILVGDSLEDCKAARTTGIHFIGRQNQESFDGADVPISPDLLGVITALRELMSL